MRRSAAIVLVSIGGFVFIANNAYPQDIEVQARALKLITDTAYSICNNVRAEGSSDSERISGDVRAQLDGLIGKLINTGITGAGSYNADHYVGLIQKDLPKALTDNAACKTNIFEKLQPMVFQESKPNKDRSDVTCPSIEATWYSSDINSPMTIKQNGCSINSVGIINNFYHELKGHWDGENFEFSDKQNNAYGCPTIYYGKFTAIEDQQMIRQTVRSSGSCGVPAGYTNTMVWVRR